MEGRQAKPPESGYACKEFEWCSGISRHGSEQDFSGVDRRQELGAARRDGFTGAQKRARKELGVRIRRGHALLLRPDQQRVSVACSSVIR